MLSHFYTAFLQTDLFLDYLFFRDKSQSRLSDAMALTQFLGNGNGAPTGVSIHGKFDLKINQSMKTP